MLNYLNLKLITHYKNNFIFFFRTVLIFIIPKPLRAIIKTYRQREEIQKFFFPKNKNVKKDIQKKYPYRKQDLLNIYVSNKEFTVRKWNHYIPIYERNFSEQKKKTN